MSEGTPFPDPERVAPPDFLAELRRHAASYAEIGEPGIMRALHKSWGEWYTVSMTEVSFDENGVDIETELPVAAARAILGLWEGMLFEGAVCFAAIACVREEQSSLPVSSEVNELLMVNLAPG